MTISTRREHATEIFQRLEPLYADLTTGLTFSTPLELLVATILSAQCTDERVNKVTQGPHGLFAKYRSCEDYLKVPESELAADIRPTGFFNQKTKSIRGACGRIVEQYGGEVPRTMEELLTLPGVARKTANIVLGNSYDVVEGIAVDTHVQRLSQRLGLTTQSTPEKIEADLIELTDSEMWGRVSDLLIWHGRRVCGARSPACGLCVLADICPSAFS